MSLILVLIAALLPSGRASGTAFAQSLTPVKLHLPWYHQFQFAGYYVALEQGYYEAEGLDVRILEGNQETTPIREVLEERAAFGVATTELALQKLEGAPLVVLGVIFQHSPVALMTLRSSGLSVPSALIGKRVMTELTERDAEVLAMIKSEGLPLDRFNRIRNSWNVEDLINGNADALAVYATNEPYFLERRGVPYTLIRPIDYGVDFYGDSFFTSEDYLEKYPERVAAFRRATLKGWTYTFDHLGESIELILERYQPRGRPWTREYLAFQAEAMRALVLPSLVEIGHMNAGRWESIASTYKDLGLANPKGTLSGFLYAPDGTGSARWATFTAVFAAVALITGVVAVLVNLRLHKLVDERTRALDKKNIDLSREIADRKMAERAVRQSEERYRKIVETSAQGILTVDSQGIVTYVNERMARLLGSPIVHLLARPFMDFVSPGERLRLVDLWRRRNELDPSAQIETQVRAADGRLIWVSCAASLLHDAQGTPTGALAMVSDITERKETLEDLGRARELAEAANQMKTRFLATVSHEIRTPLSAIIGFAELLLNPQQSAEDRRSCALIIKRNGEEMRKIIDDVLDVAKVEAGQLTVETTDVDVRAVFTDVSALLTRLASDKGVELRMSTRTPVPTQIKTDGKRLRQILVNVIGNAVKFTDRGRVEVSLAFRRRGDTRGGDLVVLVSDTGSGIAPEMQAKLFVPFSQGNNGPRNEKFGGSGLGLAFSRNMARILGGELSLKSSVVAQGSTFELILPVSQAETFFEAPQFALESEWAGFAGRAAAHSESRAKPVTMASTVRLEGMKVLVVDDAPDNQLLVSRILKIAGAVVDCASNGRVGMELALKGHYDAVLMDIQMPELDGYEATRALRMKGYEKPIIALTAHAMKDERQRCLQIGFSDHLTKPVDRTALLQKLSEIEFGARAIVS